MKTLSKILISICLSSTFAADFDQEQCKHDLVRQCGNDNFIECRADKIKDIKDPKCVSFFQKSVVKASANREADCMKTIRRICNDEDIQSCAKDNLHKFPAHCRKYDPKKAMASSKDLLNSKCSRNIQAKCKMQWPSDHAKVQAAVAKYKSCLDKQAKAQSTKCYEEFKDGEKAKSITNF